MTWLAFILLIASVAALQTLRSWRLALLSLFLHYAVVSILMIELGLTSWAGIRLGVGGLSVTILFITLSHEDLRHRISIMPMWGNTDRNDSPGSASNRIRRLIADRLYELGILLLTAVISYGLAMRYPFPTLSTEISFAAYFLGGTAFLSLMAVGSALRLGVSLLLLDSSIQLLGSAILPGRRLMELSLGGSIAILLALAISFLLALEGETEQ